VVDRKSGRTVERTAERTVGRTVESFLLRSFLIGTNNVTMIFSIKIRWARHVLPILSI